MGYSYPYTINMTVKQLIDQLKTFPENRRIILSTDAEGNGYAELDDIEDTDETRVTFYPKHEMTQEVEES